MFYIRTTKTRSSARAVQVVRYENRKTIVVAHIGSAHTKEELKDLKQAAGEWIRKQTKQPSLFNSASTPSNHLLVIDKCQYLGIRYTLAHTVIRQLLTHFQFTYFKRPLLSDLALIRIFEPASKLRSLKLLQLYFGIHYPKKMMYQALPLFAKLKKPIEAKTVRIARSEFQFHFSLVFYDVTTLYFESFTPDEFRKNGFSKDNKSSQPQIVIGLLVNTKGFPVAYEIFAGNKFEGHTIIPVIKSFQHKHKIKTLTVVADAAMLSLDNIQKLKANNLNYIVGARMANLPLSIIQRVSAALHQQDGKNCRVETSNGDLVCDFSLTRYRKDKSEMDKQIKKAGWLIADPSAVKRAKFLKNTNAAGYALNNELIEKTKLLLGLKGYFTNLELKVSNEMIISHYHNLWRVEQAFRMAKSDLEMRPIYHFKVDAIKAHILICFMALAVSKYMEIKTGKSLKVIIELLRSVTDARILNTLTNQEITLRSVISNEVKQLLRQIGVSY